MQIHAEGKTKLLEVIGPRMGRVHSKDDITGGNGARHDILKGKGEIANATTCHVFEMLQMRGDVPLAYIERDGDTFITQIIDMILVEIVIRNEAAGSYCKRNPHVEPGTVFSEPIVEFYYKTTGKLCFGENIGVDDPFMVFGEDGRQLWFFDPAQPVDEKGLVLTVQDDHLSLDERLTLKWQLDVAEPIALSVNRYLKNAWEEQGGRLVDLKIECGIDEDNLVVVGDVIDCDSWRVIYDNQQLSKQPYREGALVEEMLGPYRLAERLTSQFNKS